MNKIVAESGTRFALPSRTMYLGRDGGLDQELGESAKEEVASWRRTGTLPFPNPAAARIDELEGTLDYPPSGSVEEDRPDAAETHKVEKLSGSASVAQPEDDSEPDARPGR